MPRVNKHLVTDRTFYWKRNDAEGRKRGWNVIPVYDTSPAWAALSQMAAGEEWDDGHGTKFKWEPKD